MFGWLVTIAIAAEPGPAGAAGQQPPTDPAPPAADPAAPAADPATPPDAPLPPRTGGSNASHLIDAAVSLYLGGEATQARRILQGVLVDSDTLSPRDRQDALAWLGDIQYAEQGTAAAQSVLASLLALNPDYAMDPLVHPPDFCDAFERLRSDVAAAPRRPDKHPYPWELGLPFGAGYFIDGEPLPGIVFGTLQAGGVVTSIATRVEMSRLVGSKGLDDNTIDHGSDDEQRFLALRTANGISAAIGWAAWGVPFLVETARWSVRGGRPQVTSVELRVNGVAVAGRF